MTRHTACSESSYWLAERAGCGAAASPASWRLAGPASGPARRLPVQSKQPTGSGPGGNGSRRTCCRVAAGSSLACPRCFLALPLLALARDSAGHGLALRPVSQCDLGRRDRGGEVAEPRTARLRRRDHRPDHLVVRAEQRAVCQRVRARPFRHPGHRSGRVRGVRHGSRHRRRLVRAGAPRAGRGARRFRAPPARPVWSCRSDGATCITRFRPPARRCCPEARRQSLALR